MARAVRASCVIVLAMAACGDVGDSTDPDQAVEASHAEALSELEANVVADAAAPIVKLEAKLETPAETNRLAAGLPTNHRIVDSRCDYRSNPLRWVGLNDNLPLSANIGKEDRPTGSFYYCVTKYKLDDLEADADYYAVSVEFKNTPATGNSSWTADVVSLVTPRAAPVDDVYDASPTWSSTESCSRDVSVELSLGWFAASVPFRACRGTNLIQLVSLLPFLGMRMARWRLEHFGLIRDVPLVMDIKVAQGVVPKFYIQIFRPDHTAAYNDATSQWENVKRYKEIAFDF